jgi:hypothetical protein
VRKVILHHAVRLRRREAREKESVSREKLTELGSERAKAKGSPWGE